MRRIHCSLCILTAHLILCACEASQGHDSAVAGLLVAFAAKSSALSSKFFVKQQHNGMWRSRFACSGPAEAGPATGVLEQAPAFTHPWQQARACRCPSDAFVVVPVSAGIVLCRTVGFLCCHLCIAGITAHYQQLHHGERQCNARTILKS